MMRFTGSISTIVFLLCKKAVFPFLALLAYICLLGVINGVSSQESVQKHDVAGSSRINRVKIVSPMATNSVGFRTIIKGTAKIIDDSELWVFARPKFMPDQWWPQPKPIMDKKGNWEAMVYLGLPEDIGYEFEIAVATFSKKEVTRFIEYHARGKATGSWHPINLPEASSNIDTIVVKKARHY